MKNNTRYFRFPINITDKEGDKIHNKTRLRSIVKESVKRALRESQELEFDDDGFPTNIPEDVVEWGMKCQRLGLELSRLCGKYRYENNDLYEMLRTLDHELNAVNGDLNTFGIAPHWNR